MGIHDEDPFTSKPKELIAEFLGYLEPGELREGLRETPDRVVKAWKFWTSGYGVDPASVLKTFEDGAEEYDQLVFQGALPFAANCVVGSTFVDTPRGRVPIQYLKDGDWVYTVDPMTYEISITKCRRPRITQQSAKLVRVYTDHDTLLCTPDHRILTFNRGWVEAQNLRSKDSIVSMYRSMGSSHHPQLRTRKQDKRNNGPAIKLVNGNEHGVTEHRFIWWCLTGEWLKRKPIHHINEKKWDNDPSNLQAMSMQEHNTIHKHGERLAHHPKRKRNAALASGQPDVRRKRSASVKAHWEKLNANPQLYKDRTKNMGRCNTVRDNHVVFCVEEVSWQEDVWCMNVPKTKTFFANGMAVHNCEHHMTPFFGLAHVGYIPNGRIVGLSKLSRLVEIFARRLTVQERITTQVAEALMKELRPRGVGVVLQCRHLCMESRGIQKPGTITITSALRGCIKDEPECRSEFMSLVNTAGNGLVRP